MKRASQLDGSRFRVYTIHLSL